ncbi:AAA family ATPase [Bacillus toyonensis]|uniref:AAA family ATPase n=1 Tax=Bacillus toyonensis TaxID=155322 RepID=UPI0021D09BD9|nr:AAA family ATPase [Bacillus toyonensis]MCU4770863.1 AAA family ATPase [Bacillus toyonensis]
MIRIDKNINFHPKYYQMLGDDSLEDNHFLNYNMIKQFVKDYFNGKCSYCEVTIDHLPLDIDFYRPINGVLNTIDGVFHPEHYRWLRYQDDNVFSICLDCKRAKSNRFPVEGELAPIGADMEELVKEKRLLLNPYRDYPEKHFTYNESGMLYAKTKKGQVTIDVLNLNRSTLMEGRSREYSKFNEMCSSFAETRGMNLFERILREVKSDSMFAGLKRHILFDTVILNGRIPYYEEFDEFFINMIPKKQMKFFNKRNNREEYSNISDTYINNISDNYINNIKRNKYYEIERRNDYFDVTNEKDLQKYYIKQRFIEKLEICNFKGIKDLKIDLRISKSSNAPWLMLLGENGVGKSSILQAIALTLMGEKQRRKIIKKKPVEYLRNGSYEGSIKIQLSGMKEPISLFWGKEYNDFSGKHHEEPRVLILGYGSTRLLPREEMDLNLGVTWARTENLFNPFVPLVDVREYLLQLESDDFLTVKQAIESLFLDNVIIERDRYNEEIYFNFPGSSIKLVDLSDGYKTIIALATDIMMVMKNRWRNFDAEGIVLIDEIDAHLHPRWNIKIVSRLKRAFPKVQFISTTHNPLSLRGLIDGEIAVLLENEDKEVCIVQNLPNQKEFNVEGLLTSRFFGLHDTIPELNGVFDRYYQLLSIPNPNAEQEEEIELLKNKLSRYEKLGNTLREQKFYEVVDKYLANSRKKNSDLDEQDFNNIIKDAIDYFER